MKKTSIGGQALIEGLLFLGPKNAAIAVRKPDGEIVVDKRPLPEKSVWSKIPVIRGTVNMFKQMVFGVKALMYSADFVDIEETDNKDEEKKPSRFGMFIDKLFGGRLKRFINENFKDAAIYLAVIISIFFSVGLFILLPNVIAGFFNFDKDTSSGRVMLNLFEGLIKVLIFFGYLVLASLMKEIKRVWQYHGAEHKTIHCYEHGEELTVENIRKYTTKHPRCGTSFLFLVIVISIIVFSFSGWHSVWLNMLIRLALVPLVAGISYEVVKFAGRCEWKAMKVVNAPGLFFQLFTTKEPEDSQIEVAIEAFKNVLVEDEEADKW